MPSSAFERSLLHSFPTRRSSDLRFQRRHSRFPILYVGRINSRDATRRESSDRQRRPRAVVDPLVAPHVPVRTSSQNWSLAPLVIQDRKSTRLNSSHTVISYAVFCLRALTSTLFPYTTLFRSSISTSAFKVPHSLRRTDQ